MALGSKPKLAVQSRWERLLVTNPNKPENMDSTAYKRMLTYNKARRETHAYILKQQGMTLEQIGAALDPPVSRERARQMISNHEWWIKRFRLMRENKWSNESLMGMFYE